MGKKLLMLIVIACFGNLAFAQEDYLGDLGPQSGNLLIEITASPFGQDEGLIDEDYSSKLLSFGTFRTRYFFNETLALRLGAGLSINNANTTPDVVITSNSTIIVPGMEFHFINESGFTSYVAIDLPFQKETRQLDSKTGPSVNGALSVPSGNNTYFSDRSFFSWGSQISAGGEYHINSRLYVGVEIGFFIQSGTFAEVEVDGELYQKETHFLKMGINTQNSIRIGFKLF